jgi:hypothetical protein
MDKPINLFEISNFHFFSVSSEVLERYPDGNVLSLNDIRNERRLRDGEFTENHKLITGEGFMGVYACSDEEFRNSGYPEWAGNGSGYEGSKLIAVERLCSKRLENGKSQYYLKYSEKMPFSKLVLLQPVLKAIDEIFGFVVRTID